MIVDKISFFCCHKDAFLGVRQFGTWAPVSSFLKIT
jgi:hypothetical protein